jgi:hypothetical protein
MESRVVPESTESVRGLLKKPLFAAQHLFSTILKLAPLQIQNSPSRLRH